MDIKKALSGKPRASDEERQCVSARLFRPERDANNDRDDHVGVGRGKTHFECVLSGRFGVLSKKPSKRLAFGMN